MKRILTTLFLTVICLGTSAQPSKEAVRRAIDECATYATTILLDENGKSRCDYNLTRGEWYPYEEPWHTGQLVLGLLEAYKATGNEAWLAGAVRGGNWWLTLEIKDNPHFQGMVGATHGDVIGNDQIVFATVSDGTPGIFELSRVTGDKRYAALATSSAAWMLEHMYYPEKGVCYDLADLRTGKYSNSAVRSTATKPTRRFRRFTPQHRRFAFQRCLRIQRRQTFPRCAHPALRCARRISG